VIPTIPILFFTQDPLGAGVVNSLARPSGNMTGISLQTLDQANKRFELLRETVPGMRRLAVMANANNN
jgi:putative ABC transport system substrate-binding protein